MDQLVDDPDLGQAEDLEGEKLQQSCVNGIQKLVPQLLVEQWGGRVRAGKDNRENHLCEVTQHMDLSPAVNELLELRGGGHRRGHPQRPRGRARPTTNRGRTDLEATPIRVLEAVTMCPILRQGTPPCTPLAGVSRKAETAVATQEVPLSRSTIRMCVVTCR